MIKIEIKRNVYYDSVSLMLLTKDIKAIDGVNNANICMATDHNKQLLKNIGLLSDEANKCGPNDLIIAVDANEEAISSVIKLISEGMNKKQQTSNASCKIKSLKQAIENNEKSNLVVISVPGEYASYEAERAIKAGKHVMLFSDNVSLENEIRLKKLAKENQVLMMGPDCGTAIINGRPLCFANKVKSGRIGIVGASGTGIQEVSCLIDTYGGGITHAIGTGGRDLSLEVGGVMMEMGIEALANDNDTDVIVLISKPPHPEVADKIIEQARNIDKRFVINFLGEKRESIDNITFCSTLEKTAIQAVNITSNASEAMSEFYGIPDIMIDTKLRPEQKYIRGLFAGGTLCDEALLIAREEISPIYSNNHIDKIISLDDPYKSYHNTFVDLGDDIFTRGKPHPMIDTENRNLRIVQESMDPEVAVILLDFVLGYGSHDDPAGSAIPYIQKARKNNSELQFIASITGTRQDPQDFNRQYQVLIDNGVVVASSNAQAAKLAISMVKELVYD
jgi:succinyl-CoA synthetase alpha subunit